MVGLVGPNGSGKSTILRTVYRMLRPATGSVRASGNDVWATSARNAARVLAAVIQAAPSDLELTVAEWSLRARSLTEGCSAATARKLHGSHALGPGSC
ncbi:ATP-binding cassette domain-containing protein [Mycetocola reblochoni]|uniref:ATP-binding cassette domain-containing protein n=1 Tax=Microbacteriaceae TaxID=85023 RepID=UPI001FE5DA71|nr:ABC transporter ATP-binding protein [Mycetocola reblochoni]